MLTLCQTGKAGEQKGAKEGLLGTPGAIPGKLAHNDFQAPVLSRGLAPSLCLQDILQATWVCTPSANTTAGKLRHTGVENLERSLRQCGT